MTEKEIVNIRERNEQRKAIKATAAAGPWKWDSDGYEFHVRIYTPDGWAFAGVAFHPDSGRRGEELEEATAEMIVSARNDNVEADVDALIDTVLALRQCLKLCQEERDILLDKVEYGD